MSTDVDNATPVVVKRRKRDDLGMTRHQERYAGISKVNDCYLVGSKALKSARKYRSNSEKMLADHYRAKKANAARILSLKRVTSSTPTPKVTPTFNPKKLKIGLGFERRNAISYLFKQVYDSPAEDKWGELNIVNDIMNRLLIINASRSSVIRILQQVLKCVNTNVKYDGCKKRNRKREIEDMDESSIGVY